MFCKTGARPATLLKNNPGTVFEILRTPLFYITPPVAAFVGNLYNDNYIEYESHGDKKTPFNHITP